MINTAIAEIKNGASLLLDIISEMNNPSQSISYSKLV